VWSLLGFHDNDIWIEWVEREFFWIDCGAMKDKKRWTEDVKY
jgi:hypothetical protein